MPHRKEMILGVSLKMYLDIPRTVRWARAVREVARLHASVRAGSLQMVVLPSLPALAATRDVLEGSEVRIGAQDLFWEDRGAYTGGVSGEDLRQAGCSHVEIGHAERRSVFGEDDTTIRRKLHAAVRNRLTPILCVGEQERGSRADAAAYCISQVESALDGLTSGTEIDELVVAYEPVWAIGAERPASIGEISDVTIPLRDAIWRDGRVSSSKVIYGGSAGPGLLTELGHAVDGLFLGRFAHDPDELGKVMTEAGALL